MAFLQLFPSCREIVEAHLARMPQLSPSHPNAPAINKHLVSRLRARIPWLIYVCKAQPRPGFSLVGKKAKSSPSSPTTQLLSGKPQARRNSALSRNQSYSDGFSRRLILPAKILRYPYPKLKLQLQRGYKIWIIFHLAGCGGSPMRVLATPWELLESPLPSGAFLPSKPQGNQ